MAGGRFCLASEKRAHSNAETHADLDQVCTYPYPLAATEAPEGGAWA